jgi:hypothetical protein
MNFSNRKLFLKVYWKLKVYWNFIFYILIQIQPFAVTLNTALELK